MLGPHGPGNQTKAANKRILVKLGDHRKIIRFAKASGERKAPENVLFGVIS